MKALWGAHFKGSRLSPCCKGDLVCSICAANLTYSSRQGKGMELVGRLASSTKPLASVCVRGDEEEQLVAFCQANGLRFNQCAGPRAAGPRTDLHRTEPDYCLVLKPT